MKRKLLVFGITLLFVYTATAQISPGLQQKISDAGPQERVDVLLRTGPEMTDSHVQTMRQTGEVQNSFTEFNTVHLELPARAVENLAERSFVETVNPNYKVSSSLQDSAPQIDADEAWSYNASGQDVEVAVLDTGVDADHTDLQVEAQIDFTEEGRGDQSGHGTHVAGIVSSQNNERRGVAYGAEIYDVKVLNETGSGTASQVLDGLEYAVTNDMDVAVMSLGADVEQCDGTDVISEAVDDTVDEGVTVVAAAGNEGPETGTLTSPGCSESAITVGAVDETSSVTEYSSRGPTDDGRTKPDVVAPGTSIESTWNDGGFRSLTGTSMAAPHVAGQAAMLIAADSSLSPKEVKNTIEETAEDLGADANAQGEGLVDVNASYYQVADINVERTDNTTEDNQTQQNNDTESSENMTETPNIGIPPTSPVYGLKIAFSRASVAVGLRSRESVMEQRAREAREMAEKGNQRAAEKAIRNMQRTAGNSENATRQAEQTLQRVMKGAPEQAQQGLQNAFDNLERQRGEQETPGNQPESEEDSGNGQQIPDPGQEPNNPRDRGQTPERSGDQGNGNPAPEDDEEAESNEGDQGMNPTVDGTVADQEETPEGDQTSEQDPETGNSQPGSETNRVPGPR